MDGPSEPWGAFALEFQHLLANARSHYLQKGKSKGERKRMCEVGEDKNEEQEEEKLRALEKRLAEKTEEVEKLGLRCRSGAMHLPPGWGLCWRLGCANMG